MINMNSRRQLGDSVAEYLVTLPYEINSDGEGLWAIVLAGRSFGLSGSELKEFVELSVGRLIDVGGRPVRHANQGKQRWIEQTQYGDTKEDIVREVVAEWLADLGGRDPPWEWLWFVTPKVLQNAERWQGNP